MYPTKIVAILLFILVNQADAIVYELGLNYGYDKSIYGSSRQNSLTTRTYSMGVALYLFEQTAIDLNYSEVRDLNISNERVNVASNTDLIMYQTNVQTYVYGIGLKQQLLPKGAFIIPTISAGMLSNWSILKIVIPLRTPRVQHKLTIRLQHPSIRVIQCLESSL